MHSIVSNRVHEVERHFLNGDVHLATRRMLDCALDTRNMVIFKSCLHFLDWFDNNSTTEPNAIAQQAESVLKQLLDITIHPGFSGPLVTASQLGKQYTHGRFSLSNVDLSLNSGEIIGLVGENGNGKTTLLRLLAKELQPKQGSITYHFTNSNISDYELRSKLIYIPQRIPRWYGSLMTNLHFTLTTHGIKGEDNVLWAEMMVARLGLRPYKHLNWNRISSGYKTRFELAKNLLRSPQIMLLDEPLANLDILSQQTILQDIKHLSQSISQPFGCVLSSQQLFEVEKVSSQVIFLKNGQPKYGSDFEKKENDEVVFEVEAKATKEQLLTLFKTLGIIKLVDNGGTQILHFPSQTTAADVYRIIASSGYDFNYVRNITRSSRRFFAE